MRRLIQAVLSGAALLIAMACGGGGGNTPPPPPPAPSISSFLPAAGSVLSGNSTTLTAIYSNGSGVIDQGIGTVQSGVPINTGVLTATKTFTLTVSGTGTPATAQTTVTVVPPPTITSFTVSPSTINVGSGAILAYTFSGGTGSINQGIGSVTSGGSTNVGPTTTTTYTLTVTGPAGTTPVTSQTTLTVNSGPAPRTVAGTVTYDFVPAVYTVSTHVGGLNFAGAVQKPVRNGVMWVVNGPTVLATGNTDEFGHYSLTFMPPGSGTLQVVALASCSTPSIIVQDNTAAGALWAIGATLGSGNTLDLRATHGWTGSSYNASTRLAAPFAILDSMYTASRAFMAVRPNVIFPQLKVNWSPNNVPQSGDKAIGQIGTSHFSPAENQIYILGKEGADTDEFDSHVIVHEWGHYFERNLSRSDSPGGSHGGGDILDPRLSFGEGYGNALAAMLLPESLYVDTLWGSGVIRAFGFDAETEPMPTDDPQPGPFSETTVMRLLYDIFDSGANEAYDQVNSGLGVIYDVLIGPEKTTDALTTIGSFVAGLKTQGGINVAAVDTLLAHYLIGPISTQWGDGDPNLSGMYSPVNSLPYSGSVSFDGGYGSNKWQQNQYWVVTGNGSQITVRTTCTQDVDIKIYRSGTVVGTALSNSGNETLPFNSQAGVKYVVVVIGYGANPGSYNVGVAITTP